MDRMRWIYCFGDVRVDPHSHRVVRAGTEVALEPKAFALLQVFLDRPGELLDRDQLLDLVWHHRHVGPATLNRIVAILRRALGDDAETPRYIETVHGLGYRFVGQIQHEPGAAAAANPEAATDRPPEFDVEPGAEGGTEAPAAKPSAPSATRIRWLGFALLATAAAGAITLAVRRPEPGAPAGKSVAVLPFQNMSAEQDNAYLVDGMRDEILTRLAGIRDLKVISRSSADQYESHPQNLRVVAAQLGVAALLEGSVQTTGHAAHITVQLIDAKSDAHLWAESYDRDLDDAFAVERDVAERVAAALKAELLPEESARVAREPTTSPEAYDHYLRALAIIDTEDIVKYAGLPAEQGRVKAKAAVAEFQKALNLDPDFALARALMAQTQLYDYWIFEDRSSELLAAARNSAEEALAQQPSLGEAHLALALYHLYGYHNYALALKEIELARRTLPNSAKLEVVAGLIERRQGQWEQAAASYERAVTLDPRSESAHADLMQVYMWTRHYAESAREHRICVALNGSDVDAPHVMPAIFRFEADGDLSLWPRLLARFKPGTDEYEQNIDLFFYYGWFMRDFRSAAAYAESSKEDTWAFGNDAKVPRRIWLAWAYTQLADEGRARPLYESVRKEMQELVVKTPADANAHLVLGFADAGLGLRDEAVREGIESTELMPVSHDALDGPDYLYGLSLIYLQVGEYDKALDLLQKMVVMPALNMATPGALKLGAQWDPVRNDPRFAQALARAEASVKSRLPSN